MKAEICVPEITPRTQDTEEPNKRLFSTRMPGTELSVLCSLTYLIITTVKDVLLLFLFYT